ncbi:SdpI family protein [Clostridium sp. BJN0001]|uniref:SdpI family protein n=1 Tax=Clostridium sp. BJN0001 TaxID=2930219 RepID=UPI001FD4B6FB|nr:SdpI family protein [Clostridium sp. BJN0001]
MKNKSMILSTIICLSPIILSVIFYNRLPDMVAVHFNNEGIADGYMPKAIAAFGMPVFLAVLNIYSWFMADKDPKGKNAGKALKGFLRWIIPIISVVFVPITLIMSIGKNIPIVFVSQSLVGVIITIIGNYLPKCKRNYTIGIKLPWTLNSEDNWNKTHRFSGFIWVIGGIIILFNSLLSISSFVMIGTLAILVIVPFIYSYMIYRNEEK